MCNTCPHSPDHEALRHALQYKINEAAYELNLIRTRLFPLLDFAISQCDINDNLKKNPSDKMFAEVMLVSIRDLRNQVINVQELLQGSES